MRKRCRECGSTSNIEAPWCDACGCPFVQASRGGDAGDTWKGRILSISCGSLLIAAAIYGALNI